MLQEHIVKLQEALGLKEPLGNDGDSYALLIDDTRVTLSDSASGFQLYAKLGSLPLEKTESFLQYMLRANLFGQATHNAVLGLDEGGTNVTLRFNYPQKAEFKTLFESVEDFMNTVIYWKEEIKKHPSPNAP